MDDAAADRLQVGDRVISKTQKVRTVTRMIRGRHDKVRAVYLTKLLKVKRGIFQIGESCVERWTLKHQYERYDGPE